MATLAEMRTMLEEDVQPIDISARLSPGQLDRALNFALMKYDSSLTIPALDQSQQAAVLVGAMAKCYWMLAAKYAEGMQIQIENDEFFGQQPYEHYVLLARSFDNSFEEACGGATIEVSTLRRRSLTTGNVVPLAPGDFK